MNEKPLIDLSDDDFGAVVNCAIRYCLGRRTYMPGLICSYVKPLLPHLSEKTICCMERDIREAPSYGDDCDLHTWMDMLDEVQSVIDQRGITRWR